MHGLLSFFHVAVHHTDVTVDDADILRRRVGILFGTFSDFNPLNEQAQEFRRQFVDRPEAFCLLDKGFYIRRRRFQLIQPLQLCGNSLLQRFLFRIVVSGQSSELIRPRTLSS